MACVVAALAGVATAQAMAAPGGKSDAREAVARGGVAKSGAREAVARGAAAMSSARGAKSGARGAKSSARGAKSSARGAKAAAKRRAAAAKRLRAVKLTGDVAWVPPEALASARPPLTGDPTAQDPTTGTPGTTTTPTGTTTLTTPTTTLPTDPPTQQALGATVDERTGYTLRLSRSTLAAGSVVLQLINQGEDPHNLRIVPTDHAGSAVDLPETGPQQQSTKTLTLTPGSYYLYCTLTTPVSHEASGMHATLHVDP